MVNDSPLIWVQDCLHVIQDMMCAMGGHRVATPLPVDYEHPLMHVCVCGQVFSPLCYTYSCYNRELYQGHPPWTIFVILCQLSAENFLLLFVFRPCNVPKSPNKTDCLCQCMLHVICIIFCCQQAVYSDNYVTIFTTVCNTRTLQLNQQRVAILHNKFWLTRLG